MNKHNTILIFYILTFLLKKVFSALLHGKKINLRWILLIITEVK